MFRKCKYVLPLMLGVTLVNSGYSMKSIEKRTRKVKEEYSSKIDELKNSIVNGINSIKNQKKIKIFVAIEENNLDEVAGLLESNPHYINAKDEFGNTPIHIAVYNGNASIAELLIKKGANINVENNREECPIHIAVYNGNASIAELLIEKGANIDLENRHNQSPLHIAVYNGNASITKLLIDKGAKRFVGDESYYTPIDYALEQGNYDIVELLVNKGFDAEDNYVTRGKYYYGSTVLQKSLKNGYTDIARLLIEKVVDKNTIDSKDEDGKTPLHIASEKGYLDIVKLLIEKGFKVNTQDSNNKTPLDLAYNSEIRDFLTSKGAKKGSELN